MFQNSKLLLSKNPKYPPPHKKEETKYDLSTNLSKALFACFSDPSKDYL